MTKIPAGEDLPLDVVTGIKPDMTPRKILGELPLPVKGVVVEGSAIELAWKDMPEEARADYNRRRLMGSAVTIAPAEATAEEVDPRHRQLQESRKKQS